MKKKFSIKKSLIFAAQAIIEHFFLFFGIMLFGFLIFCLFLLYGALLFPPFFGALIKLGAAINFGSPLLAPTVNFLQIFAQNISDALLIFLTSIVILWFLISTFLNLGLIKIILNIYDRKPVSFSLLFSQYRLIIKGFFATLLYYLMVIIGFIFFIIPGIIILVRFGFYLYYLVDTNCSIIESFKKSWHLSSHVTVKLLGVCIVLGLIGTFILKAFSLAFLIDDLVFIYIYRVLKQQNGERNNRNGKIRSIPSQN